ncbi:MAG: NAD(P)-binding protein [Planctomycetota bacterium]
MTTSGYDVAIIGSGFSGSILAWILAKQGRRVAIIDSSRHPRFAIGESSTPIADRILAKLGERYGISELVSLSSYGSWQRDFPDLVCGKKRGFSYFDHRSGTDESHLGERSLLVAASPTDDRSDTHWLRSDVDAFLFRSAVDAGAVPMEGSRVTGLECDAPNRLWLSNDEALVADVVIDASGRGQFLRRMRRRVDLTHRLQTKTRSSFAHFENVGSFSDAFDERYSDRRGHEPFDADDAAQHHLIDHGWVWMLRMNNGVTSVGVTTASWDIRHPTDVDLLTLFSNYPLLHSVMRQASLVAPDAGVTSIPRIQQLCDPILSKTCWMLPTTAFTLDPLHSTGIAHALVGVQRVAEILLENRGFSAVANYRKSLLREALLLDHLVAMAYRHTASFERFTAACMVYFAAAIHSEERMGAGEMPSTLWLADDAAFRQALVDVSVLLASPHSNTRVLREVAQLLQPWNTVGLLNPDACNRYAYTATK